MTDFDPQYLYPDGALSATGHASNIGSDAANPQYGLYTLINGSLTSANLDALESFDASHVNLSELGFFEKYSFTKSRVLYDETIGGTALNTDDVVVPCGIGLRYFLPCQMTNVRIDYSFFMSGSRNERLERTSSSKTFWEKTSPVTQLDLFGKFFVDGVEQVGHKVQFPISMFMGEATYSSSGNVSHATSLEHLTARQVSGTVILHNQIAGVHEFEFRVKMENPAGAFTGTIGRKLGFVSKSEPMQVRCHQRLTVHNGCITLVALGMS